MKLKQEKSHCCAAKIIRFGGKRRQCTACGKTWRVHPAKSGRKSLRKSEIHLRKVFNHGFSVKQLALHSRLSIAALYKRFDRQLKAVINKQRIIRLRGKNLILIVDAEWRFFKGTLWTLYCLAIKSADSQTVTVFDPVLKLGKESTADWHEIISKLSPSVKNRIKAVVSDGIRGFAEIAYENGWVIQRCHFHLLSLLQKMRGKRATTPGRLVREEIYQSAKMAITDISKRQVNLLCKRLALLAKHRQCPRRMRMIVRELLRHFPEYRSYLEYSELNLPTTINVMESINSYIRRKAKTVNTPNAWHRWAVTAIRFKSKFTCK